MTLRLSITSRLIFWITALLLLLFAVFLAIIQSREVRTLDNAAQAQAGLIARYMADLNQQPLVRGNRADIQKNVDDWTADTRVDGPVYIVIYYRSGEPYVISASAAQHPEIIDRSRLDDDAGPDDRVLERTRVRLGDRWLRVLEVEIPVFLPGQSRRWASVKIGHSLEPMAADIRQVRTVLILVGIGGFVLGILGATLLAKRITRPIKKLVDGTVRISHGDFSHRIEVRPGDEIGELAQSFNEMTRDLLQTRERMEEANRKLVQAEKLASIGKLAATIAHEIRNPLTSVKLNVQKIAEEQGLPPVDKEHAALCLEGIGQIEKFVKELLNFTRVAELNLERFSPEQVLEESLKMIKDSMAEKGIVLEKTYAGKLPPILVDGDKIRQVFLNVLRNAQEAVEPGGRVTIVLDTVEADGRRKVRIRISDNGPGVPEKDRDNIFEPFFTTKPAGFGLGLANARKIIEQHSGTIRLARKRGKGCQFVILIPCEEDA